MEFFVGRARPRLFPERKGEQQGKEGIYQSEECPEIELREEQRALRVKG